MMKTIKMQSLVLTLESIEMKKLLGTWIFTVLRTERKMARRFAKVSEEEIVAINERAFFLPI